MFSMHSPQLWVRALVSLVSIPYFLGICDPIIIRQVFSPTNAVFSGIGILLLVSIIFDLSVPAMTLAFLGS
jgi:hypothetical protein